MERGWGQGRGLKGDVREITLLAHRPSLLPHTHIQDFLSFCFPSLAQLGLESRENDDSFLQYKKIDIFSCIVLMVLSI